MTDQQRNAALLIPIPTRYGTKEFLDAEEIANGIVYNSTQSIRTMELVIVLEQVITQQPFLLARRWRRPSAM